MGRRPSCSFCGASVVMWAYATPTAPQAAGFVSAAVLAGHRPRDTERAWFGCRSCADLIAASDLAGLVLRTCVAAERRSGRIAAGAVATVEALYGAFLQHRRPGVLVWFS